MFYLENQIYVKINISSIGKLLMGYATFCGCGYRNLFLADVEACVPVKKTFLKGIFFYNFFCFFDARLCDT